MMPSKWKSEMRRALQSPGVGRIVRSNSGVDARWRTLRISAPTERHARIEAISPEQSTARWHIYAHVITIGIIAIHLPNLVIDQAQLKQVGRAARCIERHRIMHNRFYILRCLTRAQVGLYYIEPIMRGRAVNLGCIAILHEQDLYLGIGEIK